MIIMIKAIIKDLETGYIVHKSQALPDMDSVLKWARGKNYTIRDKGGRSYTLKSDIDGSAAILDTRCNE